MVGTHTWRQRQDVGNDDPEGPPHVGSNKPDPDEGPGKPKPMYTYNPPTENRIERCPDCDIPVNIWVNKNQCYRCGHPLPGDDS